MSDQLDVLKERANKLGIDFHPNIGEEKLRAKINEKLDDTEEVKKADKVMTEEQAKRVVRNAKHKEAMRLVRCRVTCMNPNKREWEGEILTASNAIASAKKYVPFNGEPYHVPRILLNMMMERKCQVFKTVPGPRGNKVRKGHLIPEFSIEILPDLTPAEASELAKQQALAAGKEEA